MKILFVLAACALLPGCKKERFTAEPAAVNGYRQYFIAKGDHYCDRSTTTPVKLSLLSFKVKFDSTAVYKTADPENQYDINKLMGFTEGIDPHVNSARIGWSYNNSALHLYAYTYRAGERMSQELTSVHLFEEIICSIKVTGNHYVFTVNGHILSMPRLDTSYNAEGYLLFPYFGGDETAPADVHISISGPDIYL